MKRFEFSLHSVLRIRALNEKQAQQAYLLARQQFLDEQAKLERLEKEWLQLEKQARLSSIHQVDIMKEKAFRNYFVYLQNKISQLKKNTTAFFDTMQLRQMEYMKAQQKSKIVSKLQERKRQAHNLAVRRQEQKQMDELAGSYHELKKVG